LYIKQIRDCTIGIQSLPSPLSYRNANQPLDKIQRITFDTTSQAVDITIDKIINIIDDDDCGPTTCWVGSCGAAATYVATAAYYANVYQSGLGNHLHMAGTTGSFPVDWVLKLEQNREEGWGPI